MTVKTITSELNLRYLDWVKSRMAMVERLSGGKVGYIHLPDTAQEGNRMLQKLFYAQASKPALLIDDRYNGGGLNVPTFRIYDREGNWVVENEGITPDIEVFDDAGSRIKGHDPSLEKGVEVLLNELERNSPREPKRPVPPDMTKQKP